MPVIRIRENPLTKKPHIIVVNTSPEIVESFVEIFDDLSAVFVERAEEIEAIKYCLLTRSHLMLEGRHGLAKSLFADQVFRRISGGRIFKKLFMETTTTDEIFGPMDSKRYRENAEWHHNTAGMLPDAHFFFGDEIYRASGQILPAMLGVLNEREFINGVEHVDCPLITAIGTTNFTIDDEKLAAFHDRWHVRIEVQPLNSPSSLSKLLGRFVNEAYVPKRQFELSELLSLQMAVNKVTFEREYLDVYSRLTIELQRAIGGDFYLSDRRRCAALRFVQASAVLAGRTNVIPEDFAAARYMLITVRKNEHEGHWATTYNSVITDFQNSRQEMSELTTIDHWLKTQVRKFDGKNTNPKLVQRMWSDAKKARNALLTQPIARQPKSEIGKHRKAAVLQELDNFLESLSEVVNEKNPSIHGSNVTSIVGVDWAASEEEVAQQLDKTPDAPKAADDLEDARF